MKKIIVFAGVVLAVLLFAMPQVISTDDGGVNSVMTFEGKYQLSQSDISGEIEFSMPISKSYLDGNMVIRGFDSPIELEKILEFGNVVIYHGTLSYLGQEYEMRMMCIFMSDLEIYGRFGISELESFGAFSAELIE